jgi:hypothetical protein
VSTRLNRPSKRSKMHSLLPLLPQIATFPSNYGIG